MLHICQVLFKFIILMRTLKHTITSLPYFPGKPQQSFFKNLRKAPVLLNKFFVFFHTLLEFNQKYYAKETTVIKRLTRGLQSQQKESFLRRKLFYRVYKLCMHGVNFG